MASRGGRSGNARSARKESSRTQVPTNHTHHVVELRWLSKMIGHLSAPSVFVTNDAISEFVGERRRIQTFCFRFLLEQQAYFIERHAHVFDKSKDVVQISTLHALDQAAQLLGRNLVEGVDSERYSLWEIRPHAVENCALLDRGYNLGVRDI